jgi:hypothetical protein
MKRRLAAVIVAGAALLLPATAYGAPNPNGTGPPSQSCQSFLPTNASAAPGHTSSSPGSPFDEPGFGSQPNGGTGGQHYSAKSQYDVACFQQVSRP